MLEYKLAEYPFKNFFNSLKLHFVSKEWQIYLNRRYSWQLTVTAPVVNATALMVLLWTLNSWHQTTTNSARAHPCQPLCRPQSGKLTIIAVFNQTFKD